MQSGLGGTANLAVAGLVARATLNTDYMGALSKPSRRVVAADVRRRILRGFDTSASARRRLHRGFENGFTKPSFS